MAHFDGTENPNLEEFVLISITASHAGGNAAVKLDDKAVSWVGCKSGTAKSEINTLVIYGAKRPLDLSLGSFSYDDDLMRLQIKTDLLNWCDPKKLELTWTYEE